MANLGTDTLSLAPAAPRTILLETPRLRLCEFQDSDLPALHAIFSNPEVMAFWPAPFTFEQTRQWLERTRLYYRLFGLGRWAVMLKATGELIGDCGLLVCRGGGLVYHDLGWVIDRPRWGQGYATEAARACLEHALGTLGLDLVIANMPADHAASMRVAEKIGMKRVGSFLNARNRGILTCLYEARSSVAD